MTIPFLGGLTAEQFLQEYWQKKPLLVRNAFPGFSGLIDKEDLFDLASDPEAEVRLVEYKEDIWQVQRSPFKEKDIRKKRKHPWTFLVQGLNLSVPKADAFMRQFNFVPWARLDDLMVSYAVDTGGVGPHYDDYDVFLVQGLGQRRWQIGPQEDKTLVDGAPLKILKNFKPVEDWVVNPGDLLYLPPDWAHNGIAIGECTTYSVGFRSPLAQELTSEFLTYLQERIDIPGLYADPDLKLQEHPGEIGEAMVDQVADMIARVRWDRDDVRNFLGCYLSEPKPHIYFDAPKEPLSRKKFLSAIQKSGLTLDARTQFLFSNGFFFMNGETEDVPADEHALFRQLADQRKLPAMGNLSPEAGELLYVWYCDGFLSPDSD